jgi:hypothetical protein
MHPLEVLVLKLLPVYALAASSIALSKVAALDHEGLDDPVEDGALVVQRFARGADAFLAGAEGAEVLGGLGDDWGSCQRGQRRLGSEVDVLSSYCEAVSGGLDCLFVWTHELERDSAGLLPADCDVEEHSWTLC